LVRLCPQFLGPRQIERRQRGIELKIEGRRGAGLTVREASELFAVPEEKLSSSTFAAREGTSPRFWDG
jgi:hypothetical protein